VCLRSLPIKVSDCSACNDIRCGNCKLRFCDRCCKPEVTQQLRDQVAAARRIGAELDKRPTRGRLDGLLGQGKLPGKTRQTDFVVRVLLHEDNPGALERMEGWVRDHDDSMERWRTGLHGTCSTAQGKRAPKTRKPDTDGAGSSKEKAIIIL